MGTGATDDGFGMSILDELSGYDLDLDVDDEGRIALWLNDVFYWATSTVLEITNENVADLKQAIQDSLAAGGAASDGGILFGARQLQFRPQNGFYAYLSKGMWPLLDACGPAREQDFGNPLPLPKEPGGDNGQS